MPLLAKASRDASSDVRIRHQANPDEGMAGIRCPLCHWRPSPLSRWCCAGADPAQPAFRGCGTLWNTFATRGRCPGCAHRWQWTHCLACSVWSPHDEWYVEDT